MASLSFRIRRKRRAKSFVAGLVGSDSLSKAAGDRLFVSIELDGKPVPIDIGGKARNELEVNWGPVSPKELLSFLSDYRTKPGNTHPQPRILESLHRFLFADRAYDSVFAKASDGSSEILVNGDQLARSLLTNIPWELAEGIPQVASGATREPELYGTLASLPLARLIENTTSNLALEEKERLYAIYCISEPIGVPSINAKGFYQVLDRTLRDRSGMLEHKPVLGRNFSPSLDQLLAEIDRQAPHILIVVCHGRTANGVPQLRFENWKPVHDLAAALGRGRKTFFVMLIACDQVYLDEGPSAHSGALVMIENGIPWVVAMQSSVSARLAGDFLGATVDRFFQTASIAKSVAAGRIQMAPSNEAAREYVDWSFPALFVTEDAQQHAQALSEIIQGYVPALEQMLRKIPIPEPYFVREKLEESLDGFLMPEKVGLSVVAGGIGTGKTSLVRSVCRRAMETAIRKEDPSFRPVLYVDFDRYPEPIDTIEALFAVLRRQTEEIQPVGFGPRLVKWQRPRSSPGSVQPGASLGTLLALIDSNKMLLVLDNVPTSGASPWPEFIDEAKRLINSLVLVIGDNDLGAATVKTRLLSVEALTRAETKSYVDAFAPSQVARADEWYDESGGVLLLLNEFRKVDDGSSLLPASQAKGSVELEYASVVTGGLSDSEINLLYTMVHLPAGVNSELAWEYVCDWRELSELAQRSLLSRDYRFNLSTPWLRVPRLLARALTEIDREALEEAGRDLADQFMQIIGPSEDALQDNLVKLAERRGGRDLIQDLHKVFVDYGYRGFARAIPFLLHEWLFKHGRWHDAFKLWERLLKALPQSETESHEWLKFASAAHGLGMTALAHEYIGNALKLSPTRLDSIDIAYTEANLFKDGGVTANSDKVAALYDKALELIEAAEDAIRSGEEVDAKMSALDSRRALVIYNRALFRRYWLRDLDNALADLEGAAAQFGRHGMEEMRAMADCEWVEVQFDWPNHTKDWTLMGTKLFEANEIFASREDYGDRAFCNYQLARYYRRLPFANENEREGNAARARDAYRVAAEQAKAAGDVRLEQIAQGHLVEVRWRDLSEITDCEATTLLTNVARVLKGFDKDAWSKRVLRDMLLLRARTARKLYPETVLGTLEEAWSLAIGQPLHPKYRQDARRAAHILCEYLAELEASNDGMKTDAVSFSSKKLIEAWLERPTVDPLKRQEWLKEVCNYGSGPGEYYGQSKNQQHSD
jgi:hypothetical protein